MRLNLYWRGRDVIDVELHVWRRRPDNAPEGRPPNLEASGGGCVERANNFGDPATISGFGFQRGWRAPRGGGYRPEVSMPEPEVGPRGPAGASQ